MKQGFGITKEKMMVEELRNALNKEGYAVEINGTRATAYSPAGVSVEVEVINEEYIINTDKQVK
ncbi:MAG: hypothetical protein WAM95_06100 [Bacillus sp. (in: firmicutes)]